MKKTIALALSIVLVLVSLSCIAQAEEGPRFVTIQEWLDARGECGECMLLLKITQILNPVLAVAGDEMAVTHYKTLELNASDCVGCGHCDSRCPFSVHQSEKMQTIREYMENR